ncbi:hypothetical protein ES705_48931 [subsurface metagenome]
MYKMLETKKEYSYQYIKEETEYLKRSQIKNIAKKIKQFGIKEEEINFAF